MFTGIIEQVGRLSDVQPLGGGRRLTIEADFAGRLRRDQSVAVNGCCQTVVEADERTFSVVAVEETLAKTTLGALRVGDPLNLERAMPAGGRLDGHIVQGHVDTTGEIVDERALETSRLYRIAFDAAFSAFVIPVGSVAVDGISLTVARLGSIAGDGRQELVVSIIPHTYQITTVREWTIGRRVNLEFDLIGKYVARWMDVRVNQ